MLKCTLCGETLEPHECISGYDEELCELYINCPNCHGSCEEYDEEGEENAKETC